VSAPTVEAHPWNEQFTWEDHTGPFQCLTEEQVAAYDRDGFVLVPDVFDAGTLDRAREEIAPHDREVNELLHRVDGGRISVAAADRLTVTVHLVARSPLLRDLCADPRLAGISADLVGPDVRLYWDQAVYKWPHNDEPVPWHQDNGYTYVEPQAYLTCWIPLVDATLDNGCVWVLPGYHRHGTIAHWNTELGWRCLPEDTEGAVPVEAPAGSVVVFSSLTPHRTGPNHTDGMRSAYIVQYAPDGAEALEGDPRTVPAAAAGRRPLDDPTRQYLVVQDGVPVAR
jgi:phytanoyl-CoA hydroxylase